MTLQRIVVDLQRVGNFNVMSEDIIEYYVTELLKQEAKDVMILGFLTENFNIELKRHVKLMNRNI